MGNKTIPHFEQYQDYYNRLFNKEILKNLEDHGLAIGKNTVKTLSKSVTWQVTDACNLACSYCIDGESEIFMADYTKKRIKDIVIGDKVLGFDEFAEEKNKQTKVRIAEVKNIFEHIEKTNKIYKIITESGLELIITGNHKVLHKRNSYNEGMYDYKAVSDLKIGDNIYFNPLFRNIENKKENFSLNYKIGYLVGVWSGDGSIKKYYRNNSNSFQYKVRLAVKDSEIINRVKQFMDNLEFNTYLKPFLVSKKENLITDAIFSNRQETYDKISLLINSNLNKNNDPDYYLGYLAGIYDTEGSIDKSGRFIRIINTDLKLIEEIENGLRVLGISYVLELDEKGTKNKDVCYSIRLTADNSFKFLQKINSSLPRKNYFNFYDYSPLSREKIVEIIPLDLKNHTVYNIETTTGTYIANGLCVHNCYQHNKGQRVMPLEVGKAFVDWLLTRTLENCEYINPVTSPSIILEFIGGEPFLQVELIGNILDYWERRCIELDHPWLHNFMISICSNGVRYFEPDVQDFLRRWQGRLSFSISIDGNKELHDACRIFPDGSPSYDLAVAGAQDWMSRGGYMGSKITLAPGNIMHAFEAIKHMYDLGYREINANCVYESGWETEHATILYEQMKKLADFFLEHADDPPFCSLYSKTFFTPMEESDNQNWCGGLSSMLACDPEGYLYPCLRYMESSLGDNVPPIRFGDVWNGIGFTEEQRAIMDDMNTVTRRSQSTDECFYCPIASGCSWCSAFNYETHGTYNKRATFICVMHKARSLANSYYWNKRYEMGLEPDQIKVYCPREWAIPIIGEEEYNYLLELSGEEINK